MKKIKLILFSFVAILFVACTDDTNQYSNQLFTDSELNRAFRQCLTQSADTANSNLSIPNSETLGYYNYADGIYRIEFPTDGLYIADTLELHGLGYLVDTLVKKYNYAAELCGNGVKVYFNEISSSISFPYPYAILNGDSTAITSYFEKFYYQSFVERCKTLLTVQFIAQGIQDEWHNVLNIYFMQTGQIASLDLLSHVSEQMAKSFIKEMKKEETLIRRDATRRGPKTSKLYEVFATID